VLVEQVEDEDALAAHLAELMAKPELRETLARRAIDVRDRFSTARVMALWSQLFGFRWTRTLRCGDWDEQRLAGDRRHVWNRRYMGPFAREAQPGRCGQRLHASPGSR